MKKHLLVLLVISGLVSMSCSSNDDGGTSANQTVNIKFDITTGRNSEAIINTTINNDTETTNTISLPFSLTYAQEEVSTGTYLKLTYLENGSYNVTPQGSSWTDYTAELKIIVDNTVVKTETFTITESNSGLIQIDYTF